MTKPKKRQVVDLSEKEMFGIDVEVEEKKSADIWMRELFIDNKDFFEKAIGSYRKKSLDRAKKSFEELQKRILKSSENKKGLSLKEFKKIVNSALGKLKKIDDFTVSEGFKNSVREVFFGKKEIKKGETKELSTDDLETESVKKEDVFLKARKFAKEGQVLYTNEGVIIIEKYIVDNSGNVKVVFYNDEGDRMVDFFTKFKRTYSVDGKHKNYKTKVKNDIKRVMKVDKECLDLLDLLSNKVKRSKYEELIEKLLQRVNLFTEKDGFKKVDPEDFYEIREVLSKIKQIKREIESSLEKENEKKIKDFEKEFGLDENYVLITNNENGHEFSQDSFTLIKFDIKNGKIKVLIEWHGKEKKEWIKFSEFKKLLKKGFRKEERNISRDSEKEIIQTSDSDHKNNKNESKSNSYSQRRNNDYRDRYFEAMGWKKRNEEGSTEGNLKKNNIDDALEEKLNKIIESNPHIKDMIVGNAPVYDSVRGVFDDADLKDKVLMLLGEQSNFARRKYLEKDYQMDKRLGGIKRFFGRTFKMDGFEEELRSYKEYYEDARERYKNAILELEGIEDREDAEILAYEFQMYERLRWRNDRLEIAMENNPRYESFKKFLLGAVKKYRKMRRWPGDKISELFGFKGLSKGVGVVSGMLITGKVLKEIGMIGNPASRVFSVAISSIGYKQALEVFAERKRIKHDKKEIKKVLRSYGADFEIGNNVDELNRWLSKKNKELDKEIQEEKYWQNWRTIMAGGMAMGTFFGADILGRLFRSTDNHHYVNHISDNQGRVEGNVNSEKLKKMTEKYLSGGDYEIENTHKEIFASHMHVTPEHGVPQGISTKSASGEDILEPRPLVEHNEVTESSGHYIAEETQNDVEISGSMKIEEAGGHDNLRENIVNHSDEIVNPNLILHRNITGSELETAYGVGLTPAQYAKLNDVPIANITDRKIRRLWTMLGNKIEDPSKITLGEFFRQIDFDKIPKNMSLAKMSGKEYIEYLASVINYEAKDLKSVLCSFNIHKWNEMKNNLAAGELDENFREFYSEMSRKFSLFARPNESVDKWLLRLTKFAYDRGVLAEVKKDLEHIISKK